MTPWTMNPEWFKPMPKREVCGRVSDRYTPCPNRRPCPVHDSPQDRSAKGAGGNLPLSVSPAPRFFDEMEEE